jgi:hypothetical protein
MAVETDYQFALIHCDGVIASALSILREGTEFDVLECGY